ncbi:aldo/keto reductase [Alloscardovia venturai]|uniref:Aldo/keto reductase n=1 Tax=Alloscardovia venturai TaxID=1769421 RepID=A0ABW2Y722_9BIFI
MGGGAGGDTVFGNHMDAADLKNAFERAMSHGLNLFDTAFAYENGDSERILGELASTVKRGDIIISDRFTPQMANPAADNTVMDMLNGLLQRMGMDYFDIYWIHNSADVDRWTPQLVGAVKSGKIKRVGVSNHSLEQIKHAQEILDPFGIKISAVQNHFSLLYRNSIDDGLLDYCKENDIQFFFYMVLEQGALSGKYDSEHLLPAGTMRGNNYNPMMPALAPLIEQLCGIGVKYGVSAAQVSTAWAIGRGTTPILGVTKPKRVDDAAGSVNLTLTADEVENLENTARSAGVDTCGGWEGQA